MLLHREAKLTRSRRIILRRSIRDGTAQSTALQPPRSRGHGDRRARAEREPVLRTSICSPFQLTAPALTPVSRLPSPILHLQITLDATPELQGKYTIFGRVVGPTIYNVLSISEVELSPTEPDRPVYPPKLNRVDVLENPFDDIVPRITRQEKRQQAKAKRDAAQRRAKNQQQAKGKKYVPTHSPPKPATRMTLFLTYVE